MNARWRKIVYDEFRYGGEPTEIARVHELDPIEVLDAIRSECNRLERKTRWETKLVSLSTVISAIRAENRRIVAKEVSRRFGGRSKVRIS